MKDKKNLNESEIRNTMLPLAVTKPDLYKKLFVVGMVVFYLMVIFSYFTDGFFTNYIYLQLGLIALLMFLISHVYDSLYINTVEEIIDAELAGVVIGFSNKLLILTGDEVMDEIDTDEILIRSVNDEEEETFFSKYTSVLECFKDGELVGRVGVDKIAHLEGATLKPDMSRVDEDMVIVYDDDEIDEDLDDCMDDIEDIGGLSKEGLDRLVKDLDDIIIETNKEDSEEIDDTEDENSEDESSEDR